MKETIILAGSLAQKPGYGGHTWVFLQYLLGFKRLGYDVLFLDQLEPAMCVDHAGNRCGLEESFNLRYFLEVMERFGLADSFALICNGGERWIGLTRSQVLEGTKRAPFILNVMGFLKDADILSGPEKRVFLDIDPGFGQMWQDLGLHDPFVGHDCYVTVGANIGKPGCLIPACGLNWITTRPPVVLDYWQARAEGGDAFTSIASWRGLYGPIVHDGKTYGLRVHEFRKFAELPRLTTQPFQLALDIHPADAKDRALLESNNWSLVDPRAVARDPCAYQSYIQNSRAELMVAKSMYVDTRSGWFSDRSACYLASGRPVIAQDTGLGELSDCDAGLLTFSTVDEAAARVEEVARDYRRQAQAALDIAHEYFDSDKVLSRLLSKLSARTSLNQRESAPRIAERAYGGSG